MGYKILFILILGFFFASGLKDKKTVIPKTQVTKAEIHPICTECALLINRYLDSQNTTAFFEEIIQLCIDFGYGNDVFCNGMIPLFEDPIIYILDNTPNVTGKDVCGTVFEGDGCKTDNPDRIWDVTLPNTTKPPIDEPPLSGPENPVFKVLHLSDTHFDPLYYPGADTAHCLEEYLCCREISGIAANQEDGAGFWGDYRNCDSPRWTLAALYDHISQQHPDIDFIFWTGDLVPHAVWETTRESNLAAINEMADLLYQYFPSTVVYPAVGNHEASPVDLFPQPYVTDPEFDISWLYDELNRIWQRWLPASVANSIAYGAFYSTKIRSNLRVISLNTNYCYTDNFWLIMDSVDAANELQLLINELQDAEDKGDFVYLIGHIPPGKSDCLGMWSHNFNKIVSRYESTISGIFYGHTHKDHFQLYFDPADPDRVYEIGYVGQSQTTYTNINPGYKIYTIEGDFTDSRYRVIDHENYALDLDASNRFNATVFFKLYSAKEEYNLVDLSPQSWLDFVYVMNEPNSTYFDQFYRNYVKAGTPSLEKGCDDDCKYNILCFLLTSDSSDKSHCDILNV